jgi:hypothetical protein
MNEDGRLEVFARFSDGRIYHLWQTEPNGAWGPGWQPRDHGSHRFGNSLAVASNHDGRLELFANIPGIRQVGHIAQAAPNGDWGGWDFGSGGLIGGTVDAVCAIDRLGEEPLQITGEDGIRFGVPHRWLLAAARRENGRVHIRGQNAFGWWTNGKELGPDGLQLSGIPSIATNQDGRLEMFARGADGTAYHVWENSTDHWATWAPMPTQIITSNIGAALTIDGRLQVFARGADGSLVTSWQIEPNSGWHVWENLGGNLAPDATPAVALNSWGQLQVFVRWSDGSIRSRRQQPDQGWTWTNWQQISRNASQDPMVVAGLNGLLIVFQVNTDNALYATVQSSYLIPMIPIPIGGLSGQDGNPFT